MKDDHAAVDKLFRRFDRSEDDGERGEIAHEICAALTRHAEAEEAIFYPAVRDAIDEQDLVDEAAVEHGSLKALIELIEQGQPGDDLFDARVVVLKEYVKHHVREEEDEMFPKVRRAGLDLEALGEELEQALRGSDDEVENETREGGSRSSDGRSESDTPSRRASSSNPHD